MAAQTPAVVNKPPAYTSLPDTASAYTSVPAPKAPPIPEPSADLLLPSHLAMLVAAPPPAVVNPPPAYTSPPDTASARTSPSIPEPNADQLLPFHLAIRL